MAIGQEFKEFILRGKVVDLAVGVAVGGAFTKIVETIVQVILMPIVALFGNDIEFAHYKWVLRAADTSRNMAEISIQYGLVIDRILTFLIVGVAVFLFIKGLNRIYKADNSDQAKITNDLLREMRDLMAKQNGIKDAN